MLRALAVTAALAAILAGSAGGNTRIGDGALDCSLKEATVNAVPHGPGSVGPTQACGLPGQTLKFDATPDKGAVFAYWKGCTADKGTTCIYTVPDQGTHHVDAVFHSADTPPSAPSNLKTDPGQTSITLTWDASTDDNGIARYDVYLKGEPVGSTKDTGFTFTGLACGTPYSLSVLAVDTANQGSAFSSVDASTGTCPTTTTTTPSPSTTTTASASTTTETTTSTTTTTDATTTTTSSGGPGDVVVGDPAKPDEPDELPPPVRGSLAVSVSGNGTVLSSGGRALAAAATTLRCGVQSYACYAESVRRATVSLRALPARGFVFKSWSGACSGSSRSCAVSLDAVRTVKAVFVPRSASAAVASSLERPRFSVRWLRSVGKGQLIVSGRVARPAQLRVQLRRPGGGPLLTVAAPVLAGRFTLRPKVAAEVLPRGARLLPGPFVVSLSGRSGRKPVVFQVGSVTLKPPAEGVVRRSYGSDADGGRASASLPTTLTQIWANFDFAAQPRAGRKLTVTWYFPDGRPIGVVPKPNRPEVSSFLRSNYPIPRGIWVAELRAGGAVVQRLGVRLGV